MLHLKSIRSKLLAAMLSVFLLFALAVLLIWYAALKYEAESTAISNMKTIINVSNTTFENQVKDIINVTALTTVRSGNNLSTNIINIMSRKNLTDAEIVAYRSEARDYLISLCSFKKHLNGLMLSDLNGNNVTYGIITPYEDIIAEHWLDRLSYSSNETIFIEPHYSNKWYPNQNDLVFSIMRPVYDFSNNPIGFAIADINCQLFTDSYDVNPTRNSALYILNQATGEVIFSPQNDFLALNESKTVDAGFLNRLSESSGDFFTTIENQKMLVVYNQSQLTGWCTLSVIPETEILSTFRTTSQKIFIITCFLLLCLIICIYLLSTLLTKNIVDLTNSVKRIDKGNLALDVNIHSQDETGALALQFNSMLIRIRQLLSEIKASEAAKRNAEIAALQFQMNPHFLYNSLNTIKFLATLQGSENIQNVADSLSSLMHINMDGRSFISIEEDIAFIEAYLSIQKYRNTASIRHSIKCITSITSCLLPKLLVQPLVENAIKHGLKDKAEDGVILISYLQEVNTLHILVEDNGAGMSEERIQEVMSQSQNTSAGHIGIHNIIERIQLYYGADYGMDVQSQAGLYTRFDIAIPLIYPDSLPDSKLQEERL